MSTAHYTFPKQTIRDISVHDKRVLVRADFNVPLASDGGIESDFRITQSLPTLEYLLERGCTVFAVAHLGRPDGRPDKKFSLEPVAAKLQELLPEYPVRFVHSTVDDAAWQACNAAKKGTLTLLENLRFSPAEEANDLEFAESLKRVTNADYFVQDGFGVVHRAHASTEAITHILPSVAGLLLEKEVTTLQKAMRHPDHPLVAVVGGAKISDKIIFIEQLIKIADTILIGGAMANTFLKYRGFGVGKSLVESDQGAQVSRILTNSKPGQILLPLDVAVSGSTDSDAIRRECDLSGVHSNESILDIGSKTIQQFDAQVQQAGTVIWNGTLGYAELPQFATGSAALAKTISEENSSITSIIGGGDTADFVINWLGSHESAHFTHISTGGGASLELMSGLKLPGLEALLKH